MSLNVQSLFRSSLESRRWRRGVAPVAALVLAAGVAPVVGSSPVAAAGSGTQLWARLQRFGNMGLPASSVVFAPGGARVFVAGSAGIVAYSASSGARLWAHASPAIGPVSVSPDGRRLFVAVPTSGCREGRTVAYNAGTGAFLWQHRFAGVCLEATAVSPLGTLVFVTGRLTSAANGRHDGSFATAAYDSRTGAQRWLRYYSLTTRSDQAGPVAITVNPSGWRVFVTGATRSATTNLDYATVAYRATTGTALWVRRFNGGARNFDQPSAMATSPGKVFVTGRTVSPDGTYSRAVTIAYSINGTRLWIARYYPGAEISCSGVTPAGSRVLIACAKTPYASQLASSDFSVVGYDAATGARLSVTRYATPDSAFELGRMLVSPARARLVVVGSIGFAARATVAYDLRTGAELWRQVYHVPGTYGEMLHAVAMSPNGSKLVAAGGRSYTDPDWSDGYLTVAYAN